MSPLASARSDVGRVRTSNQDSGYAGQFFFVVADGMGGHAGGDVASGIAVRDLAILDRRFGSVDEARTAVVAQLKTINEKLSNVVGGNPELAGLGTTVSALIRVGDRFVVAHIGDSRIYRLSNGELIQVTADHTFVQQLIDAGRITEAAAKDHPRRSVLMRVLSDVDDDPSIDTADFPAIPGERWLLCSDGLTGVLDDDAVRTHLTADSGPDAVSARLIDRGLNGGGPDNITVIVLDVAGDEGEARSDFVGSAASKRKFPSASSGDTGAHPRPKTRTVPVSTSELPLPTTAPPSTVNREQEAPRFSVRARRRLRAGLIALLVLGVLVAAAAWAYNWTQTRYYLGASGTHVAVFQGIPVTLGGLALSRVYLDSDLLVSSLPAYEKAQVTQTVPFDNVSDAVDALNRMTGE
jgi:serine/threonine protein phosphatase PrpC